MLRSASSMLRKLAPILALTGLLAAGCGADYERAGAQSDARALLAETADATRQIQSAAIDLRVEGRESAQVTGAFVVEEEGRLPKFTFTAKHGSETAGAVWTGEKGYVTLDGTSYAVSGLLTGQIEAGFEEANKRQALAPDVSRWLANPRNEGVADIGGEETVKISGAANDKQVLADIERLMTQVKPFQLGDKELSPDERREASKAIGALNVTVFTGVTDRVLRRLVVIGPDLRVDLTLSRVDEDQDIEAPKDARPFSELMKRAR
jgi:hypothetical protein